MNTSTLYKVVLAGGGCTIVLIVFLLNPVSGITDPLESVPSCSDGQVATFTSDGLVCRSLSAVLGETTDECPANHYLAGFDTGAGVDSSNGNLICRPEAEGSGGGTITLPVCTVNSGGYIDRIENGVAKCETFVSGLSAVRTCPEGQYAKGFHPSGSPTPGRTICSNDPDPVDGRCGSTLNSCTNGTLNDLDDSTSQYQWRCDGENGGNKFKCMQKSETFQWRW